jgi:hypothetical protein
MLVIALVAYGTGIADSGLPAEAGTSKAGAVSPEKSRVFVLVWTTIVVLVAFLVALAIADAGWTMRQAVLTRRDLRAHLAKKLAADVRERSAASAHDESVPPRGGDA